MTDTADVAVKEALLSHLAAQALSPRVFVAFPDIAFTPPAAAPGARWMRAAFLPAPRLALAIADDSVDQISGILQVDSLTYAGRGEVQASRYAQDIQRWFARGTVLVNDAMVVRVLRPAAIGPMVSDPPWTFIPVSIYYIAFTNDP